MKKALGRSLLILVLLFAMGAAGVFWRERQQAKELSGVMARLASEGFGGSINDLLRKAPGDLDPALQERARAWMKAAKALDDDPIHPPDDWVWYLYGEAPPADLLARHEQFRARNEQLLALLQDERLCLSSLAWLTQDVDPERMKVPVWELLEAAHWLFVESLLGDHAEALDALERLQRAAQPTATILDAMILEFIGASRDRAMLALAYRDVVAAARVDAWMDEPCHVRTNMALGVRFERLARLLPSARDLLGGQLRLRSSDRPDRIVQDVAYVRWQAKRDMARVLEISAMEESRFMAAEAPEPLAIDEWLEEGGLVIDKWGRKFPGYVGMVLRQRRRHRMVRLGIRVLRLSRAAGRAPADEAALRKALGPHATLLDGGPWDVALRYEKEIGRFRLRTAPDSPMPGAIRGTAHAVQLLKFAPPKNKDPVVGPWPALEMDVDAPRKRPQ